MCTWVIHNLDGWHLPSPFSSRVSSNGCKLFSILPLKNTRYAQIIFLFGSLLHSPVFSALLIMLTDITANSFLLKNSISFYDVILIKLSFAETSKRGIPWKHKVTLFVSKKLAEISQN